MSAMIVIGGGAGVARGANVRSHVVLGIRVCGDKNVISCHLQQPIGGCKETAVDSNLIGLHLPRTGCHGRAPSARYNEASSPSACTNC